MWSVHDAISLDQQGVPSVVCVTERFSQAAKTYARMKGKPDIPILVLPANIEELSDEELGSLAKTTFEQAARQLTQE